MKKMAGKVAAITGAGAGIGRAAARLFAQHGMHVAILEIADSGYPGRRPI